MLAFLVFAPSFSNAFTPVKCCACKPGLGRVERMLTKSKGVRVSAERVNAVLKTCPPPAEQSSFTFLQPKAMPLAIKPIAPRTRTTPASFRFSFHFPVLIPETNIFAAREPRTAEKTFEAAA